MSRLVSFRFKYGYRQRCSFVISHTFMKAKPLAFAISGQSFFLSNFFFAKLSNAIVLTFRIVSE